MAEERTFTEAEHQALLQGAVEREVAQAVQDRDTTIEQLEQRIDTLEAEKAAVDQAKDELQGEFDAYKTGVEQAKEIEERKTDRVERVKTAAFHLPEDFFTPERAHRWAEMDEEQFGALVKDFEDSALAGLSKEEAKELEPLAGEERAAKVAELRARRKTPGRETAAFGEGQTPTAPDQGSVVGEFFAKRRTPAKA